MNGQMSNEMQEEIETVLDFLTKWLIKSLKYILLYVQTKFAEAKKNLSYFNHEIKKEKIKVIELYTELE